MKFLFQRAGVLVCMLFAMGIQIYAFAKDKRPDPVKYSYQIDKSFTNTMGAGWKKKTFDTKYGRLMCRRGYFGAPANDRLCQWLD